MDISKLLQRRLPTGEDLRSIEITQLLPAWTGGYFDFSTMIDHSMHAYMHRWAGRTGQVAGQGFGVVRPHGSPRHGDPAGVLASPEGRAEMLGVPQGSCRGLGCGQPSYLALQGEPGLVRMWSVLWPPPALLDRMGPAVGSSGFLRSI